MSEDDFLKVYSKNFRWRLTNPDKIARKIVARENDWIGDK